MPRKKGAADGQMTVVEHLAELRLGDVLVEQQLISAEQLGQAAERAGLAVRVQSTLDYNPRELGTESLLFVVMSTHGDGDPPDEARAVAPERDQQAAHSPPCPPSGSRQAGHSGGRPTSSSSPLRFASARTRFLPATATARASTVSRPVCPGPRFGWW